MLSVIAVAMAGLAFVATRDQEPPARGHAGRPRRAEPDRDAPTQPRPQGEAQEAKPVKRGEIYVKVFNNSGIKGLAGSVAGKATAGGWNVVGSDNWYGTVPASTVYYPPRLKAAAKVLGLDLGIRRSSRRSSRCASTGSRSSSPTTTPA